jgi:preprotein translocase subunit SecA
MIKRDGERAWRRSLRKLRGEPRVVETDLSAYESTLEQIDQLSPALERFTDEQLRERAGELRRRAVSGASLDRILVAWFAVTRVAASRVLGLYPFDVQLLAGIALHQGKLVEMHTGEGKTLAAVAPASLNALTGRGVHVLTFNDYLARRDAAWMGPLYRFLGLSVGTIQEGMDTRERKTAYGADVTYATAKEAGFDFLRMQLCRDSLELVHRPFHFAIVDEADSILIDEARVPLVIAGERIRSQTSPHRVARLVRELDEQIDFETDDNERNVFLTEPGIDRLERELSCGDLHDESNYLLLTEINQALHARVLLRRDVDYIVRSDAIELVDEFTGRVMDDRRWPDGLQAALEAKEGVPIRPGGRILGSIPLQHFLGLYPRLAGMTATARPAAEELAEIYGLNVVVIPPHAPCARNDLPDVVFTHRAAKLNALIAEIGQLHEIGRPVLVGTASVEESEELAAALAAAKIPCQVLNARNDEQEAAIVAQAGAVEAVTISTNMAGRGTDIRLGGSDESEREKVLALGGLFVIGTNRHESRRIDDQLRGRAGRQGDPGNSRFFVSLEDPLMTRFGVAELIPRRNWPARQDEPVDQPSIRREIERLQRIVEGQNFEVRQTLWRYSMLVEDQRRALQQRRSDILHGRETLRLCATRAARRHTSLCARFGAELVREVEREITLHHLDRGWEEHLAFVAELREGIHLVSIGGLKPLEEFQRTVSSAFLDLQHRIERRIITTFNEVEVNENGLDRDAAGLGAPSSTWTYLINDRALGDLHQVLAGPGNFAFAAVAALTAGPMIVGMGLWRKLRGEREDRHRE